MRRSIWERIQEIINKHVIHGKWVRSVIALSCVVIFITTYVLVMPAVTLSGTPNCGQEEHRHTDDCYETQSEQICGLEEHTHSDDCYDEDGNLICGLEEHVHTDDCYETEKVLTCGMEEHIHTSDCYNGADAEDADSEDSSSSAGDAGEAESKTEQGEDVTDEVNSEDAESVDAPEATEAADPEGPASGNLLAEGEDYTITVSYTEEANLPANVSLKVEEITNKEEYEGYKSQVEEEILDPESKKVTAARFFDITLLDSEGNELHPEKAVTVVIETKDTLKENEELQVCHFDQEQEKPVIVKSQEIINETYEEDNLGVQFEAETFYVYGIVRTKPIGTTVLTADGETYTVTVSYTEEANLPADVSLKVEEITNKEEYEGYKSQVEEEILDSESKKVTAARFFDITLMDSEGNELHPEKAVTVVIETKDTWKENEEVQVCHFDQEQEKPVIVKSQEIINETYEEDNLGVQFEAESFSVYGIVGTETISAPFTASDGNTYEVTVNYGKEAGIPEGAKLKVSEVTTDNTKYDGYVEQAADAIDSRVIDLNYVKLLDIEILDVNGNKVNLKAPVDVQIKLLDKEQAEETTQIVHFEGVNETPVVVDSSVDADTVSFSTNGFSIYAVVDEGNTGDYARMNLHFMNGSEEVAMMIVKNGDTRDELNTIIYDPGVGTIPEGQIFKGWWYSEEDQPSEGEEPTGKPSYTVDDAENGKNIDEVRDWAATYSITENEDVYLYAMLYKNFVINYLDEKNVGVGSENVFMLSTDTSSDYTVNMAYTPKDDTHAFLGWNVAEGSSNIQGYTEGTLYENGTDITITGNVTFSVNAPEGHWLVFDENGKGGTYNAPVFVESADVTEAPSGEMTRFGYTFGGWYDSKEHADAHGANPSVTTGQFQFGTTISDRTTVYASWIPVATANYTVLIWKQNLAGDGYDYEEAINLTGNTGTTVNTVTQQGTGNNAYARVNGTNKQYTGFHLKEYDQNVTITPEGNAVVNIYYDRTAYTFTFQANANGNFTYNRNLDAYEASSPRTKIYTVTRLYDQDISDIWEFTGSNGVTYPETNTNTSWLPTNSSTYTARITSMQRMPAESITFRLLHTDRTTRYFHYYIETVDGETGTRQYSGRQYNLYKDLPNDFNVVYYNDDFWQLKGFSRQAITKSGNQVVNLNAGGHIAWDGRGGLNNSYGGTGNHLYFYYTRDKYPINYMDGIYVDGNGNPLDEANRGQLSTVENLYYETDLSSYNKEGSNYYNPTYAGYVFEGWYMDEACTQPYTFTTMPLDGITVYAKWRQIQYRVFLHPNADNIADLDWGSNAQQMNFRISIGGTVSVPTGRSAEWEFVGWYTDPSCSAASLFSSDTMLNEDTVKSAYDKTKDFTDPMDKWGNGATSNSDLERFWITKKFDLYGKWRAKLIGANGIGVVYDAGEGTNPPTDGNLYLDQAQATAQAASTAPEGKQFVRWIVQKWDKDTEEYVDTEIYVYPGDSFEVLKNDARYVITETDPDTGDVIKATYTVQLRAEYVDTGAGVPTHIEWYGNNETLSTAGTQFVVSDENVLINQAITAKAADTFTYEGHKFLGWARVPISNDNGEELDPTLESKLSGNNLSLEELGVSDLFLKYVEPTEGEPAHYEATSVTTGATAGTTVSKVAPDERYPYHAMVAVWEVETYKVTIEKQVVGTTTSENFTINYYFDDDDVEDGSVTLQHGGSQKLTVDVPYGTNINMSETAEGYDKSFAATLTADGEGSAPEAVSADTFKIKGDTTITVTNTRQKGTLQINKVTSPEGIADSQNFKVSVKNSSNQYLQSTTDISFGTTEEFFDVSVATGLTIENLPTDTYVVSEDSSQVAIDGFRYDGTTYSVDGGTAVVEKDTTTPITITNSYTKLVDVTITKTLVDEYAEDGKGFTFTAVLKENDEDITSTYLTDLENGQFVLVPGSDGDSKTFQNVPDGAVLTVTEITDTDYTTTVSINGATVTETNEGTLTISSEADADNTIAFTNTRKIYVVDFKKVAMNGTTELTKARFTLTKWNGSTYENYPDGDLNLTSGHDNRNLVIGQYKLTEINSPDGYIILNNEIVFHVADDGSVTIEDVFFPDGTTKIATLGSGISDGSKGTVTVKNQPGEALPMTGGSGTLPYTLGGIAMILASALMYGFRMRRRERRLN